MGHAVLLLELLYRLLVLIVLLQIVWTYRHALELFLPFFLCLFDDIYVGVVTLELVDDRL